MQPLPQRRRRGRGFGGASLSQEYQTGYHAMSHPTASPLFTQRWHLPALIGVHLLTLLLLLSWRWAPTAMLWQQLDQQVFFALNGSLPDAPGWQALWALLNNRLADLLPLAVILASLALPGLGLRRNQLHRALVGFFLLLVLMLPYREGLHELAALLKWSGLSPSLTLQPAYLLSELVPEIPTKDRAYDSFPGDHATVLWLWAGYLILLQRSWVSLWALLVALAFMLPRLVGGAHWLTDNLIGGLCIALPTLAWAFASPALGWLDGTVSRHLSPRIYRLGERLPALQRLAFFTRP